MNGQLQPKCNLNWEAVLANIVKSVMGVSTRTKSSSSSKKVKYVMGVSTQVSSPMEEGTEMKSVM